MLLLLLRDQNTVHDMIYRLDNFITSCSVQGRHNISHHGRFLAPLAGPWAIATNMRDAMAPFLCKLSPKFVQQFRKRCAQTDGQINRHTQYPAIVDLYFTINMVVTIIKKQT